MSQPHNKGEHMTFPTTSEVIQKLRDGQAPPVSAMRVFGSTVELAAEGNSPDAKTIKVQLKARQRGPINHWYWGTVWHDLSTMRSRSKIALDDTHDVEIGYGRPVQTEYGLEVEGVVVTNPDNPAHESNRIAYNLRNGIPQEASIDFGGDYEVMEITSGAATMVNGMEAKGPALVVRNWPLRACAICKEGADASTETNALTNTGSAAAPLPRAITTFSQPKETMTETTSAPAIVVEAPPAETLTETKPTETTETAPVVPVVEAAPVVQPETLAAVDALQAVAVELEQVKTELDEVIEEKLTLMAEIAQLEERIEVLSKGIAPVPVTPAPAPMTWAQALASVRKDKPQFSEHQIHAEAAKRFPKLDPNNRS